MVMGPGWVTQTGGVGKEGGAQEARQELNILSCGANGVYRETRR